jgi:hypothetical protein
MKLQKCPLLILIFGIITAASVFSIDMRIGGSFGNPTLGVIFRVNRFDFRMGYDFTGWLTEYKDFLCISTDFRIIDQLHLVGPLHFYLGVGGYLLLPVEGGEGGNIFGVRAPVGLQLLFAEKKVEIFAEMTPTVDIAGDVEAFQHWQGWVGFTIKLPTK